MNQSSLDIEYSKVLFGRDSAANQDNPCGLPIGFHYIKTSQGNVLGFYCKKCKLQMIGAPDVVKHCGGQSKMPTGKFARLLSRLKTIQLNKRYR